MSIISFYFIVIIIVLITVFTKQCTSARIFYEACDKKGFKCSPSKNVSGKTDLSFTCNKLSSWDVELFLWQFRPPINLSSFMIANCTNVRLSMLCSAELYSIPVFHAKNISNLQIVEITHGLMRSAPEMIFEDIGRIETILPRTFIQYKKYPYRFGCYTVQKDLTSIIFKNVTIDTVHKEAFHNLTEITKFVFDNVSIQRMSTAAVHVELAPKADFRITSSKIALMEYQSFFIHGEIVNFSSNHIQEIDSGAINATVNYFTFGSNTIGSMHCKSLSVLAQNVFILDNNFNHLDSYALQGIGPGLPVNSKLGFGKLLFQYVFKNNMVESLEVGSLHSDWDAYRNVGSKLVLTYNSLKCSCEELAWLGTKEGYGKHYTSLDVFHEMLLKKENKNFCLDSPCLLPLDIVRTMTIKDGRCTKNVSMTDLCDQYYPITTRSPTHAESKISVPNTTKSVLIKYKHLYIKPYQSKPKSRASAFNAELFLIVFLYLFI